ncbi:MAG: endonuclease/exonuclease/phosphatase family protein [Rubripirellula sp.]
MRYCLSLFVVTVLFSTSSAQQAREDQELTVMTWNLEWFFDDQAGDNFSKLAKEKTSPSRLQWDWKRDAVAKSIAKSKPSILALQEVENRRVLFYLSRALSKTHKLEYHELGLEGRDFYTEQDVGMMFRPPVDSLRLIQGSYPKRLRSTNQYYDVTKHLIGVFEFQKGDVIEEVMVMNVHLRSGVEGEPFRLRQARLAHHWIADSIKAGKNVILVGDFNTEERGTSTRPESDLGIISGLGSADPSDDLIDLNLRLPANGRQTHLLPGRQFDRIFCSRSLLEDDPSKPDLVFKKIEVKRELAIQGQPDTEHQHWEQYWERGDDERDLSDHYPVMATFEMK